jgi:hypothetical protein
MNPDHPKYNAEFEEAKALVMRDLAQQFPKKERQQLIDSTIAAQNRAWIQSDANLYKTLWDEIGEWSNRTFGDEQKRGPIGPLNHLIREAKEAIHDIEAEDQPNAEVELADCLILVFDAARRYHMTPMSLVGTALEKMEVNRGRVMGEPDAEGVIEHRRDLD